MSCMTPRYIKTMPNLVFDECVELIRCFNTAPVRCMPDPCISHSHHAAMLLAEMEHETAHVRVFPSFFSPSSHRSSYLITWRTAHGPYCGYDEVWGKMTISLHDAEGSVLRRPCFRPATLPSCVLGPLGSRLMREFRPLPLYCL